MTEVISLVNYGAMKKDKPFKTTKYMAKTLVAMGRAKYPDKSMQAGTMPLPSQGLVPASATLVPDLPPVAPVVGAPVVPLTTPEAPIESEPVLAPVLTPPPVAPIVPATPKKPQAPKKPKVEDEK